MEQDHQLHNGTSMPVLGFGTYKLKGDNARTIIKQAIQEGYRLIDTAAMYENEKEVGEAVREAVEEGVKREALFVVTKVWKTEMGYDKAKASFEKSMQELGLDYIDLLLIHWPDPHSDEVNRETWKALEELYQQDDRIKAIGVSNFSQAQLKDLVAHGTIKPMVNQFPSYPGNSNQELLDFCQQEKIVCMAYSPIDRGAVSDEIFIQKLAEKYGKTPAQIALRWAIDRDIIPIPKTENPGRLKENKNIFDFELLEEEVDALELLR